MLAISASQQLDRDWPVEHHIQPSPHLAYRARSDRLIQPVALSEYHRGIRHDGPDLTRPAAIHPPGPRPTRIPARVSSGPAPRVAGCGSGPEVAQDGQDPPVVALGGGQAQFAEDAG